MDKIKNLPAMRLAAFAVAVAIILGLSSAMLSFTASAETTNKDIKTGTFTVTGYYDGYPCISFDNRICLYDIAQCYKTNNYSLCVIPIVVKNNATYFMKMQSTWNCYDVVDMIYDSTNNVVHSTGSIIGVSSLATDGGESYKNYYSSFISNSSSESGISLEYYTYSKNNGWILSRTSEISFYDYKSGSYGTSLSPGDIKFVVVSNEMNFLKELNIKNNWSTLDTIFSDNATFTEAGASSTAEFVTCKSFTCDDGKLPLWFKSFIVDGQQYPLFTYYISDNGNHHRYQLRLSYSSWQSDVINTIFGHIAVGTLSEQQQNFKAFYQFIAGGFVNDGKYDYAKFMVTRDLLNLIRKKPEMMSFDMAFTLNSNAMSFESSETLGNKVYTICLSDYSDIIANYIYRAQIVDMQTSEILDTTYFTSKETYHKGDSGTGVKIYDYGDDSDKMLDDIINNTPSVTPSVDNKFSADGDVIQMENDNYLSGLKIDNIFSVLGQSATSIGAFFQACFNIVPSAILSILLSTLSLLIVLRVLGR